MDTNIEKIVSEVVKRIKEKESDHSFEIEASARHVHLSQKDLESLFGKGFELTKAKDLSQPGQFASGQRIAVIGPKGMFSNVIILGPTRNSSQVELSLTDLRSIGLNAPVRESGDINGTPGVTLMNGENVVHLEKGLIAAKRHIHMTPEDAEKFGVVNEEIVKVKACGVRPLIFDDVVIRVSKDFATYMHIDTDEANACGFTRGMRGEIVK
ncbi:Propanediol utilization protein [Pilibacter termitis]|uniref:Phosphate propanoyltransferase n=1 Tax=Pilibacter termitis TaxID=263852 RepID=A0A1T4K5W7_9ENTE|nr:ethanolamine utilization phosphate acetyltransferase EutD [Pilibacter termitis]SJZ37824.1 Propanediol utilization protein [Pilibacter termitis]